LKGGGKKRRIGDKPKSYLRRGPPPKGEPMHREKKGETKITKGESP